MHLDLNSQVSLLPHVSAEELGPLALARGLDPQGGRPDRHAQPAEGRQAGADGARRLAPSGKLEITFYFTTDSLQFERKLRAEIGLTFQMVFGVGPNGVYLTNPLESVSEDLVSEQLCRDIRWTFVQFLSWK